MTRLSHHTPVTNCRCKSAPINMSTFASPLKFASANCKSLIKLWFLMTQFRFCPFIFEQILSTDQTLIKWFSLLFIGNNLTFCSLSFISPSRRLKNPLAPIFNSRRGFDFNSSTILWVMKVYCDPGSNNIFTPQHGFSFLMVAMVFAVCSNIEVLLFPKLVEESSLLLSSVT